MRQLLENPTELCSLLIEECMTDGRSLDKWNINLPPKSPGVKSKANIFRFTYKKFFSWAGIF